MAIELEKTYPTGVKSKYHRITKVSINYVTKMIDVEVSSYLDANARDQNLSPIEQKSVTVCLKDDIEIRDKLYQMMIEPMPKTLGVDENGLPVSPSVIYTGFNGAKEC